MKGIFYTCLLLLAPSVQAQMYKCTDAAGNVSFQGLPCDAEQITEWQRETDKQRAERERQEANAAKENKTRSSNAEPSFAQKEDQLKTKEELARWSTAEPTDEMIQSLNGYLRTNLKDPDSLKDLEWVETVTSGFTYKSHIRFRAANSFGGYVLNEKLVRFNDAGKILEFVDRQSILPIEYQ
ncbi:MULTISPECIES: DUF4124 domain-containing protein [unclassified Methylophaga]|jgi:hypothetical protein|uniref:DUF4124 domain-containing protein n=1 Tax=unclassified Methylophaga TaxID=2629249 RepID=UPI000C8FCB80|nr:MULTISPECIES: DUF4124 domain-containing protein [unclassified Methylophaga]MAK67521.1 hypothetical protein [Methylophaga sp.]MAY18754.1 hypothetical protein [Methylophaga sp.]HAO25506.1 hypothetical protein [Methylophaga sp.]HCD04453.1 hypothetical protein [Methylophaga sp.]|tara:strand:- start:34436 stop:34981 length:546 start_codon:yes stop_codon:yes gene_type:complete